MSWISPNKLAYYTDLIKTIFASKTKSGSVISSNESFAEIGEWEDGNTANENRIGYFVTVDKNETGIIMSKGTKGADIRGVVTEHPAFASNASSNKYDSTGNLLPKYGYVVWCGFVSVIDNGTCTVDTKCICGDDGTAIPSENEFGYQVISRVDENHILVLIEPHGDEMNRIAEKIKDGAKRELTQAEYDALSTEEKNNGTVYYITDGVSSGDGIDRSFLSEEGVYGLRYFNDKLSYKNGDEWIDIETGKETIGDADISKIGDGTITGAIVAINSKTIYSEEGANGLRYYNGVLAYKDGDNWAEIKTGGGSSIRLKPPTDIVVTSGDEEAFIKWTDPDDVTIESGTLATWDSTVVVRKEGAAPTDETDGIVVLTSTIKNQYSENAYTDTGLTNGVTYYYGIFPKTTDGAYTTTSTTGVTPAIIYPDAATDIAVSTNKDNMSATVTFTLPADTTATVVMKADSEPTSSTDGTVLSDLETGTATFTELVLDTTYYFKVYTYNRKNRETAADSSVNAIIKSLNIVTWADGSWEDIGAMIEAHYAGDINITDYWSNGDTKRVQLNAISAGTTGESQSAQYIDLTIIDSAHDDLVTSVNGVTKAALTIQSKFCLGTTGYMYSAYNSPSYSLWKDSPREKWCNNEFKNALPAGLVSLIKKVSKVTYRYGYTGTYASYRGSTTTQDDVFFLSEMEVFGTQAMGSESDWGRGDDGTQYEYYKTASNRIKYLGIDGTSANVWWLRSSLVNGSGYSLFRCVNSNGSVSNYLSYSAFGLAPAFCI